MPIRGLHHVSLICADAERTARFYTEVLALKAVAAPPGADLRLTDAAQRSGTSLHFTARPGDPEGRRGIGATHHVALSVPDGAALRRWKRRLTDRGLEVKGPYERKYFQSIYFKDPDGIILELATAGPGWTVDEPPGRLGEAVQVPPDPHVIGRRDEAAILGETWPEPVPAVLPDFALTGLHHVTASCSDIERTTRFYQDLLGFSVVKKTYNFDNPRVPHWYLAPGAGAPGTVMTYFGEGPIGTRPGQVGRGLTYHIAFAADSVQTVRAVRDRLTAAGMPLTGATDRAVHFADPDGHRLVVTAAP